MPRLAPSILSADFGRLAAELQAIEEAGAQIVHIDVMDGHFVPNITIGPLIVKAAKKYTDLPLDVHLMISEPERYLDDFIEAGASWLTFHMEATNHAHRLVEHIKGAGVRAGVSINPGTPVGSLDAILKYVDYVLVMTVNPGFGGQSFIDGSLDKIAAVRDLIEATNPAVEIEVDGGVSIANAADIIAAGAETLVAGSAVFGANDVAGAVRGFLDIF